MPIQVTLISTKPLVATDEVLDAPVVRDDRTAMGYSAHAPVPAFRILFRCHREADERIEFLAGHTVSIHM
jgi:hypothetical protein